MGKGRFNVANIKENFLEYIQIYQQSPIKLITLILDLAIVLFLAYNLLKIAKDSRAWQLIKGIALLVIATWLSGILNLNILNYILSAVMNWGVILLIIIFQPEIRRALEQLGTNKFTKLFGMDKDIITKTKEDIYKVADLLTNQDDITLIRTKDYIKNPKPNGYRSYHMIVSYPVETFSGTKTIRVEIQIRTVAQDFWATLEHKMHYKFEGDGPDYITKELR